MTTKNYKTMTTKKLNALLATASDEDKAAIEEVLATRNAIAAEPVNEVPAEVNEAEPVNEVPAEVTPEQPKKTKMTDEERHALAESLKCNVNHRCQVVPFNTAEWVDGTIVAIMEEKRANKVMYAIKTDDGRRIVKVTDSPLIKVLDEVVEPVKRERKIKERAARQRIEKIKLTGEQLDEIINEATKNVGKTIKIEKYRITDEEGNEKIEWTEGRIVSIVCDRRVSRVMYRINIPVPTEENPDATRLVNKTISSDAIVIAEDFDETGLAINEAYLARRKTAIIRSTLTPHDRVFRCEEALKKAEEIYAKAAKSLETKKEQLEQAKKELDEYLAANADNTNTLANEEAESLA